MCSNFIIPVITAIKGLNFEIFTLISEIHSYVNLVLDIKIVLEANLHTGISAVQILNRSIPIFQLKPKVNRLINTEMFLIGELSNIGTVKVLDLAIIITLKVKITRSETLLKVVNASHTHTSLSSNQALGILDARSLGYYNIDHKALHQNHSNYQFENLHELCNQFNDHNNKVNVFGNKTK